MKTVNQAAWMDTP